MRAIVAVLLFTTALLTTAAFAEQTHTFTPQPNTVFVGADGKYEAAPDTAVVQFNISAQADTARAANERATKAAEDIRMILRNNGIDIKAAEIGFFNISPVYDYRNPKRKLLAYRVNSSVTVKIRDFNKVAPITQQLADIDVTENQSVYYTLENIDAAKVRAVQDAFAKARASAEAVAVAGKRIIGDLVYASVDTQEQIGIIQMAQPMMKTMRTMGAEAAADMAEPVPTGFTPQRIIVNAHVNAMFALK